VISIKKFKNKTLRNLTGDCVSFKTNKKIGRTTVKYYYKYNHRVEAVHCTEIEAQERWELAYENGYR